MGARMIRKGLAVAVILLFIGVAFTSSINANVSKSSVETIVDVDTKEEDCGCEEETTEWGYPVLCTLLYPLLIVSYVLMTLFSFYEFNTFMEELGKELNCYWAKPD